jgi:hypothetical protein
MDVVWILAFDKAERLKPNMYFLFIYNFHGPYIPIPIRKLLLGMPV